MASEPTPRSSSGAAFEYVDVPAFPETFADSIHSIFFDGQSLRVNFSVTRLSEAAANSPPSGKRYPSCRLVLSPAAAVELINRMQQVSTALVQAGVLKAAQPAAVSEKRN